jgi:uncharacterized repeat protein (TIGR03803 family)
MAKTAMRRRVRWFKGRMATSTAPQSAAEPSGYGNVFRMTPAGVLTNLVSFNVVNGGLPYAGLIQGADGNLYGRTTTNSAGGEGTIFRTTTNGALTTWFHSVPTQVSAMEDLVQDADGNFYGTTSDGGASDMAIVFKMTPDGVLTNLLSFNYSNGAAPYGGVRQGLDGNFYGTTEYGGSSGYGTVFAITPNGTLTTLGTFSTTVGYSLSAPVQGANGNLYGTTAFRWQHRLWPGLCGENRQPIAANHDPAQIPNGVPGADDKTQRGHPGQFPGVLPMAGEQHQSGRCWQCLRDQHPGIDL